MNVIPFLDNIIVKNYHLNIRMVQKLQMLNSNTTAGSLKTPYLRSSKSKSHWRSDHKWAKNSLLLWRLPRISSSPELYLLSISKWLKPNLVLKVLRSTWTTILVLMSLRKPRFAERSMCSFSDTWTTQRSSASSSYSTRPPTLNWSLWLWKRLRESKSSSFHSKTSAPTLTRMLNSRSSELKIWMHMIN